jgi:hypothetical protein
MDTPPTLSTLVDEINVTTSFLSGMISRKSGYLILLVVGAAFFVKLVL